MNMFLPAGVNALLCLCIIFVSICRLDHIKPRVLRRVGYQYVFMVMAAAGHAFAPLLWEWPGWPGAAFSAAVLYMLLSDSYQWRGGAPEAATGPAPLGEH